MTHSVLLLFACLAGLAPGPADQAAEKTTVKVEFRRAETKSAEGLAEAMVAGSRSKVYLHKKADLTNDDIDEVRAVEDADGRPAIEFVLTKEGAKKMEKLTEQHLGKPLAILLNGKVVSAPNIRQKISERGRITGNFTKEEVDQFVEGINSR